jgi:predicted dinucleotide-binding enzyme
LLATWAQGAFVFKTLNTTGASNMAKAADYPVKPVMLVASDDAGRKPKVMELVGLMLARCRTRAYWSRSPWSGSTKR